MGWGRSKGGKSKESNGAPDAPQSSGFFGGGGYASFGDYMVEKNRKLKEQFAAAAASGTSGGTQTSTIFRGLSFWMTGRTCLPDQELKRIIVEHGGVYEQYGFLHVTHIIADNLASGNQTWAELKKRAKRIHVVTSSWVTACVQEGRRLPEIRFMPKCLSSASSMLSFMEPSGDAQKPLIGSPESSSALAPQQRVSDVQRTPGSPDPGHSVQHGSCDELLSADHDIQPAPAKKRRISIVSVDSDHLSPSPQRPQQKFATSALAFEVNTPCAEGLASFSELLEVLCDLATGGAQQLRDTGRCAAAVGLKITLGQRQAEWSGISGVSDNGQAALLAALTSLAHRAVAALGLSIGLSAEAPQGRTNIDPDAAYRAVCHVGIQLHFDHGVVSIARQKDQDQACAQEMKSKKKDSSSSSSAAGRPAPPMQSATTLNPNRADQAHSSDSGNRCEAPHGHADAPTELSASAEQLVEHWRAICHRVQSMRTGALTEWHKACHFPSMPGACHASVVASVGSHVKAFEELLAQQEYEVVQLALRALRAAVKSHVASTLSGDGQPPTPSHFNTLLSAVQSALVKGRGARFKVAPLSCAGAGSEATDEKG